MIATRHWSSFGRRRREHIVALLTDEHCVGRKLVLLRQPDRLAAVRTRAACSIRVSNSAFERIWRILRKYLSCKSFVFNVEQWCESTLSEIYTSRTAPTTVAYVRLQDRPLASAEEIVGTA